MEAVGIALTIGSTILSAVGQAQTGQQKQAAANYQAGLADQQAGQDRAAATQQAMERERQGVLAVSRARAVAASSGGDADGTTVVEQEAKLAARGKYNAMSALYSGNQAALGEEAQADAYRYGGAQAAQAGKINAATTILGGATSLFGKYGGGGPPASPTDFGADATGSLDGRLVGGGYASGYT